MHITIKHFDGKHPSFNVQLHSQEGQPEFVSIKGCRIISGRDGDFISWPATKGNNDKYWNHVWASDKFAAVVLDLAKKSLPRKESKNTFDDLESDIPF